MPLLEDGGGALQLAAAHVINGLTGPIGIGVAVVGAIWFWRSREEIPYSHRKHAVMLVPRAFEQAVGRLTFLKHKDGATAQGKLLPDSHPYVKKVREIGQRVAVLAADGYGGGNHAHMQHGDRGVSHAHKQGLSWEFAVVDDPTINAFVVPGGKVLVYSGVLDILSGDAEVAALLAHEIAHVVARHYAERLVTFSLLALGNVLWKKIFGEAVPEEALEFNVHLPHSRRAEHEADEIGLWLMARAGFEPAAFETMLGKLQASEEVAERSGALSTPSHMRTHPLTADRVERTRRQLPAAYKVYKESSHCNIFHRVVDNVKRHRGSAR